MDTKVLNMNTCAQGVDRGTCCVACKYERPPGKLTKKCERGRLMCYNHPGSCFVADWWKEATSGECPDYVKKK